ncbi:MAG: RNA polymerase sigma factor [bacterium]
MTRSDNIIEFTLIYNRYKTGIYNYVYKMLFNRTVGEDIVQNVFLRFFENMTVIRNKENPGVWLFTTARNEVYSFLRTKKSHVDKFNTEDSTEINLYGDVHLPEEFEAKELREIILRELENMPVEQKDIYLLKEYGGFSYKEIASTMSIDEELVKSRLSNTRQKLIKRIAKII